jgi:hypothetical protein
VAGSTRGGRRRRVLQARAVALLTIALTLSAVSSAIAAKTEPSVDETLMTSQVSADKEPKPSKPPKPSPTPSPSPDPSPSSEPSPEPSPSPSPDPTSSPTHTSSPIPNPSTTSPPGTTPAPPGGDPTGSGGAGGDTPLGSSEVPPDPHQAALGLIGGSADRGDAGLARDGTGSLFTTVASIIDELASSDDRAIRAAEAPTQCPGLGCGSPTEATTTRALFIVLTCLAIAVAGAVVILARSRRSTTELPSDRQ